MKLSDIGLVGCRTGIAVVVVVVMVAAVAVAVAAAVFAIWIIHLHDAAILAVMEITSKSARWVMCAYVA